MKSTYYEIIVYDGELPEIVFAVGEKCPHVENWVWEKIDGFRFAAPWDGKIGGKGKYTMCLDIPGARDSLFTYVPPYVT